MGCQNETFGHRYPDDTDCVQISEDLDDTLYACIFMVDWMFILHGGRGFRFLSASSSLFLEEGQTLIYREQYEQ